MIFFTLYSFYYLVFETVCISFRIINNIIQGGMKLPNVENYNGNGLQENLSSSHY